MQARPFLMWGGGKTQLLPELLRLAPTSFHRYHEPFLGGGALFFALRPRRAAVLSDRNQLLVDAYTGVRDHVRDVVDLLRQHDAAHSTERYYEVRAGLTNPDASVAERAANFVYLNRTCFNGLFRVNRSGRFNVPIGKFAGRPLICDEENLVLCSEVLRDVDLRCQDFRTSLQDVLPGDLAYLDPPYVPVSTTSFTGYVGEGFSAQDQADLAWLALGLRYAGAHVVASNSGAPIVRDLYQHFTIHDVQARRNVNSKGAGRGPVGEVVMT